MQHMKGVCPSAQFFKGFIHQKKARNRFLHVLAVTHKCPTGRRRIAREAFGPWG